jgi:lipopolysaccharide transport protein LptA
MRDETAVLEGEVRFSIRPQVGDSQNLVVQGGRMVFSYPRRRARIEGDVDLRHGRSHGTADVLELQLFEKQDDIHLLWLMGRARIVMREAPRPARGRAKAPKKAPAASGPPSYQSLFLFDSADQDIVADQILIAAFEDIRRIRGVRARGAASFVLTSSEGQITRIEGRAVNLVFDTARGLEAIDVRGPGRINGASKEVPAGRSVEGRFILYDGFNRVLKAGGSEANPARTVSEGRDVRAENLVIFFQSNSFDAWGSVMAVLEDPVSAGGPPPGAFFAAGRPVFARARLLRFLQDKQEMVLTDNVRLWQDKQVLLGPEIGLNKETQAMHGTGGVKTQFSQAAKAGGAEERVEVGGERMEYDPRTRVVAFIGNGYLRTRDLDIQAASMSIVPEVGGGRPRLIQARGSVVLRQKTREARGEAADYDIGRDAVVLTGRPVVVDKEKGTIRGDKLTFHLADGNIQVDNRDQQRSDVVIKS